MKYNIDKELKSISIYSGSMVGRLYPLVNIGYRLNKCWSDRVVKVSKITTPGYQGVKIPTLIFEPKNILDVSEKLPCIMFFHGGGFLMSASGAHYKIAKWYAYKLNCKVIMPDYRLMPKYTYPVAIEDCYSTYKWVLNNAEELGIDKEKIFVTGDSAGGNIAAAVVAMLKKRKLKERKLKERGESLPKGVLLIYPVLDKRMITESMKRFNDTPIWDSRCNKLLWEMYLKNQDSEQAEFASIAELESLDFFPDTYVEVAEFDCLHDEGIAFAHRLKAEGVATELHDIKGACHGYEAATKSSIVRRCMKHRINWIKSKIDQVPNGNM